ncbi:hypothetical protein ACIRJ3_10995 [Streptomyces anulatus]
MPAHLLRAAGPGTSVVPHDHPGLREALRHHRGPVLLGPGPGNPNDAADPRIGALRELTAELLGEARGGGNPLVGVCLGFQLLSGALGLPVLRGERPYQGTQRVMEFFGRPVTAGFYSSFRVHADPGQASALLAEGVENSRDPATRQVTVLRGGAFPVSSSIPSRCSVSPARKSCSSCSGKPSAEPPLPPRGRCPVSGIEPRRGCAHAHTPCHSVTNGPVREPACCGNLVSVRKRHSTCLEQTLHPAPHRGESSDRTKDLGWEKPR